jgi:hypothetical protein
MRALEVSTTVNSKKKLKVDLSLRGNYSAPCDRRREIEHVLLTMEVTDRMIHPKAFLAFYESSTARVNCLRLQGFSSDWASTRHVCCWPTAASRARSRPWPPPRVMTLKTLIEPAEHLPDWLGGPVSAAPQAHTRAAALSRTERMRAGAHALIVASRLAFQVDQFSAQSGLKSDQIRLLLCLLSAVPLGPSRTRRSAAKIPL